jgi:hypothetical protein
MNFTRRRCQLLSLALAALFIASAADRAHAIVLINEVHVNPPGGDGNIEFIEFISTTGGVEPLTGLVLLQIDGSGPVIGSILEAYNLGANTGASATGTNGLLLLGNNYPTAPIGGQWAGILAPETTVGDPTGAAPFSGMGNAELENDGFTLLLVTGFTGAVANDLDTNDDGIFDVTPWTAIQDSVGWRSGQGAGLGFTNRTFATADLSIELFTPDSVSRIAGDFRPNAAEAWYGGDILGDVATGRDYDPAEQFRAPLGAQVSPGLPNAAVPEPTSILLVLSAAGSIVLLNRHRSSSQRTPIATTPTAES